VASIPYISGGFTGGGEIGGPPPLGRVKTKNINEQTVY